MPCRSITSHPPFLWGQGKQAAWGWLHGLCLTGTKGNLCQRKLPLAISVALTFPSAMMASYYLLLQTYVLRLEAIMNGILLFFCGSELLLEALALAAFSRYCCWGTISRHLRVGFLSHSREGVIVLLKPEGPGGLVMGKAVSVGLPPPPRVESPT